MSNESENGGSGGSSSVSDLTIENYNALQRPKVYYDLRNSSDP